MIFPGGVSRASAERSALRRPNMPSFARSAPAPITWGQLEEVLSGSAGQYSGLISNARAYRESPWIQPTIHAFAAALAARPFRMFRQPGEEKERVQQHWLIDLMSRPNPAAKLSEYRLKYETFALYDFDGEVFWYLLRHGKPKPGAVNRGDIESITIFRKNEVRPVMRQATAEFLGWEISIDGKPYFADRDDVVHFPQFDPLSNRPPFNPFTRTVLEPARGRSSLDSKRLAISADIAAARYNFEFFNRGIAPNIAFVTKDELNEPEKDQFEDRLRARLVGKSGAPLVLGGDWTIQDLKANQKDAEFSQGREMARAEIIAGRTPPLFVGKDDASYANAQSQVLAWWEIIAIPAIMFFCATLDTYLLGAEADVWTDLATDDVEALQEAKRARITSAKEMATARVPWDVAARTTGVEMESFEGSDVAFGAAMDVPVTDIISAPSEVAPALGAAPTAAPSPDQAAPVAADAATGVLLNGAQVTAVTAIVVAVAAGEIPRDSGIGQLKVLFNLSDAQAEQIMGSAGKSDVPTTPNPNPAAAAPPEPTQSTTTPAPQPRYIRVVAAIADSVRMAGPFDYASTQVNLEGDAAKKLVAMAAAVPDDAIAEKGRETDPHVTVFYGLDPSVTAEQVAEALANSDSVLEMVDRGGASMTLGKTSVFTAEDVKALRGKAVDYDVVVLDIDSPDLVLLNGVIGNGNLGAKSTDAAYVPHATLAYVKAGRGAEFAGDDGLAGVVVKFDEIQFSDTDGNLTPISLAAAVKTRRISRIRVVSEMPAVATRAADEAALQAILQIIRGDDKELQGLVRRFHIRMLKEGAKQALALVKPKAAITSIVPIDNPYVVEFLKTRANLITSVNKTTAEQILQAVKSGIDAGTTPEIIANDIRDVYNLRGTQAKLIARQENGTALNGGRFIQFQEEGVDGLEWLSSRDDNVRESHAPNTGVDGEIVTLGDAFSNGCRYPQDPQGEKKEVMGCRCVSLPAQVGGNRSSILPTEKQRANYWRASVVVTSRSTEKQFKGALQKYFNDQRGRVLAKVAELLAA